MRRRQLWVSQVGGTTLFLGESGYDEALFSQKHWPWIWGWRGGGLGLAKNTVSLGFPERFPTFMGLRNPKEEFQRMGPPDVAKVQL